MKRNLISLVCILVVVLFLLVSISACGNNTGSVTPQMENETHSEAALSQESPSSEEQSVGAIEWQDTAVETLVREKLDKLDGDIFESDLEDILSLQIWGDEHILFDEDLVMASSYGPDFSYLNGQYYVFEGKKYEFGSVTTLADIAHFKNLEILVVGGNNIFSADGVGDLSGLKYLSLASNEMEDISALTGLTSVTKLNLSKNKISSLNSLGNMSELQWLDIRWNSITSIDSLPVLRNLEVIELSGNNVADFSILGKFPGLRILEVERCSISDLSSFTGITQVTLLDLDYNSISDISPLASMTGLENLKLKSNSISDISALAVLEKLAFLNLGENEISDLEPLRGLASLEVVWLKDNPVTDWSPVEHVENVLGLPVG